jgi:hypothetical protein
LHKNTAKNIKEEKILNEWEFFTDSLNKRETDLNVEILVLV